MPTDVDSNSPAFWRDGRLFWYGSQGGPRLSEGPGPFGPWETRDIEWVDGESYPHWLESVHPEENGTLWGWYHGEPIGLVPGSTMTVPKIGAVVSFDGGNTLRDLGIVLESGDPIDPSAQNGYFAGGHGDFSVILDREHRYFYFLFDNYGGPTRTQGVCIARMAYEDRLNPDGKVWKYYDGNWQEAGRGGRVSPFFPVRKGWQAADPDAFWGPSVHWNTHLRCYVMVLNHAAGEPGWSQEGVYISFSTDLSRPELWTEPRKILDKSEFSGWYFFYPQVMGLEAGGTDRRAGQTARLYVGGVSKWEIDFIAPPSPPTDVLLSVSLPPDAIPLGAAAVLSVSASGEGPFSFQWMKDGQPLAGATSPTLVIAAVAANDAGTYSVLVSNVVGSTLSNSVTLSVLSPVPHVEALLSNLSVRSLLPSDHAVLTMGFVLHVAEPKPLLVRAVGPSLALFGISGGVVDPRLEVFDAASVKTAENDNWDSVNADLFATMGAFPLPTGSADAGLVAVVPSGPGTVQVRGPEGGVALVEVYDPTASPQSKIVNLSALAPVGAGEAVMIGGFSLSGTGSKRLLIRALGPQLERFGVTDALADPMLELFENGAVLIAENDDWDADLAPAFLAAGAPELPPGSRDAAVVVTLAAGNSYTVVVRSVTGTTGEALLEIYELL